MNRHQKADMDAWGGWALLQDMPEDERVAVLKDEEHELWQHATTVHLACWVAMDLGLSIMFDHPRFEHVPVPLVHNYYTRAKRMENKAGMLAYLERWTRRYNPKAYSRIREIAEGMNRAA